MTALIERTHVIVRGKRGANKIEPVRMRRTAVHTQHRWPAGATIVEKMQVETISGDMTAARRRCFDWGVLLIH